jgi:nucleoside-diphosphate-sugar epimerase
MLGQKKILITGGAGFVGSQLGHHLESLGASVALLDNMSYGHLDNLIVDGRPVGRFICRDIRQDGLEPFFEGVDTVVHLAGVAALPVCQENPREAYDVNLGGTGRVLEYARKANVRRVIFSSTSAVYEQTDKPIFSEDDHVAPDLVYAMTKKAAEDLCRAYAANYRMDVIVCRFFNVYGPHQDIMRTSPPFTSYVARELAAGRAPRLYNDTDVKRDYVHVSDVVDLLTRMIGATRRFAAEIFNVASGAGYSVPELFDMMRRISGHSALEAVYDSPEVFWDRYPALFQGEFPLLRSRVRKEVYKYSVGANQKTAAEFGWTPKVNIETGLQSVLLDAKRRLAEAGMPV